MRRSILILFATTVAAFAQTRQVAITIDDLPRGGDSGAPLTLATARPVNEKLLDALRGIPVIGFVNAGRLSDMSAADMQTILRIWVEHGADLGNHTWSHPDLNEVPLEEYEANVIRGEAPVTEALGHKPVYFRHPFLHAGKDEATRRGFEAFLKEHGYRIAPITLDNSDWMFASVYAAALRSGPAQAARIRTEYIKYMESILAFFEERSKEVTGHEVAQTLLIHVSQLNADTMPDLLAMMRRRGYRFVTLDQALTDEAYRLPDAYFGTGGFSWIHRWSKTKGMPGKGEPDEPEWIRRAYEARAK
jgi:peptidoglycan-N-acetylglucosamine deacetylase